MTRSNYVDMLSTRISPKSIHEPYAHWLKCVAKSTSVNWFSLYSWLIYVISVVNSFDGSTLAMTGLAWVRPRMPSTVFEGKPY